MLVELASKPLSVNKLYYANKQHGLRPESKTWQAGVFMGLSQYEKGLADLRERFKVGRHGYKVQITYILPKNVLYNKQGEPSSRAADLSNCDKALIDCLFLPKNFSNNVPYGCQNLCMDDKHLFELSSKKVPGPDYKIIMDIELIELP